jgi:hypothetical protein
VALPGIVSFGIIRFRANQQREGQRPNLGLPCSRTDPFIDGRGQDPQPRRHEYKYFPILPPFCPIGIVSSEIKSPPCLKLALFRPERTRGMYHRNLHRLILAAMPVVLWSSGLLVAASPAKADLIGAQIDAVYYYPNTSTPYVSSSFAPPTFVVGSGIETVGNIENVTYLDVDFSNSILTVAFRTTLSQPTWNASSFNGVIFTSAAPLGITAATVDPATTMSGFDNSRVSFSSDQILLDWNGLGYVDGTSIQINFAFVPEPVSFAALGIGLLGLTTIRRIGLRRSQAPHASTQ